MSKPNYATHPSSCRCRSCNAEFRRAQKAKCSCPTPLSDEMMSCDRVPCRRCQVILRRR
jgi:hypothetical protein